MIEGRQGSSKRPVVDPHKAVREFLGPVNKRLLAAAKEAFLRGDGQKIGAGGLCAVERVMSTSQVRRGE